MPRWCWCAFWIASAGLILFFPGVSGLAGGLEAWLATEFGRPVHSSALAILGVLPLVSASGRMCVHLLQWWFPVYAFATWIGFVFDGVTSGHWVVAAFWAAVFLANIVLLWFRTRLFLSGYCISASLAFVVHPALACVYYGQGALRYQHFKTYIECFEADYQSLTGILCIASSFVGLMICRHVANLAVARRAARSSRELHRQALERESSLLTS